MQFIASGEEISGTNLLQDQPLILIQVGRDGGRYLPKLDNFPEARSLKFGHWWERDLILRSSTMSMTRRKLAFALRNSEGGAHYGQLDDADYIEVQEKPAWFTDKKQPLLGVEAATMRQIGWEILQSIEAAGLRK
ncbi:MAG TPA: hypothetical protein VHL34_09515 [Rhizomicrobium sp.]|nr:hypothetical protein [Rhizomicrobium sp.]